jgi:hypothetical protein
MCTMSLRGKKETQTKYSVSLGKLEKLCQTRTRTYSDCKFVEKNVTCSHNNTESILENSIGYYLRAQVVLKPIPGWGQSKECLSVLSSGSLTIQNEKNTMFS